MLRYAITNLSQVPGTGAAGSAQLRRSQWLRNLERWAAGGIDAIQLREKSLDAGELFDLATEGMRFLRSRRDGKDVQRPRLLVNSRPDIAAAARADGVHLTSRPGELTAAQVRSVFEAAALPECTVSVSCHTPDDVAAASGSGADLILFGPVFEKRVADALISPGSGLEALAKACHRAAPVPVLALGGVTVANASECVGAGAGGVAGIRLFA